MRSLPNVLLTPHLGYVVEDMYGSFYKEGVRNIAAFLAGKPINMLNGDALGVPPVSGAGRPA